MNDCYEFTYENKNYKIYLSYSRRLKRSARFEVIDGRVECRMAPRFSLTHAIKYIEENKPRLVLLFNRPVPMTSDSIYVFGESRQIVTVSEKKYIAGLGWFTTNQGLEKLLKKQLLSYVKERYQGLIIEMGIDDSYKCIVRNMKSRYGSISKKTNRIAISLKMVHYAPEVIDSIIIHELAHTRHFDHSRAFYQEIYKYCPNYKTMQQKLKRGEFQ